MSHRSDSHADDEPAPEPRPEAPKPRLKLADADEPLVARPAPPPQVMTEAAALAARGVRGAMATVLERHGSAPSTPGQKMWVGADRSCIGSVGGGAVEREVMASLLEMATSDEPTYAIKTFKLGAELGMCCGGRVVAMIEPIEGLVPCLVVGGGHVATALAPMLAKVGFAVTVVDEREDWGREGRIPGVTTMVGEYDDIGRDVDKGGAFIVMTHDHGLDQRAIEWALREGFAFVGGVGSRAKAQRTRDRLSAKGFSEADVARVQMPLGVDIGARLPAELAVSIAGALIAWRRARGAPSSRRG
jgi:xanthine dehydrogenase accessory factor